MTFCLNDIFFLMGLSGGVFVCLCFLFVWLGYYSHLRIGYKNVISLRLKALKIDGYLAIICIEKWGFFSVSTSAVA